MFEKLVTHADCADGLASAMLVKAALPHIEIVFAQHGRPSLEALDASPGLLFCDIVPPRARAREFVDAGATVLDHHAHARDIVELFEARGHFADERADPGVSGALLAYRHVYLPIIGERSSAERFARLIGVRDTWQLASPDWQRATELYAALLGMPRAHWLETNGAADALEVAIDPRTLQLGAQFHAERLTRADAIVTTGSLTLRDAAGHVWGLYFDPASLTSDVADLLRARGVPNACGLQHRIEDGCARTALSLRSDGALDVGALAKRHGGGGHRRAAGCRFDGLLDPAAALERLTR